MELLMDLLPLYLITASMFFVNWWGAEKCRVWTTEVIVGSLIPFINYFGFLYILVTGIELLSARVDELEANVVKPTGSL